MLKQVIHKILAPGAARYLQLLFTLSIIPYLLLRESVGANYYPVKVTWSLIITVVMVITFLSVSQVLLKSPKSAWGQYGLYIGLGIYTVIFCMKLLNLSVALTNPLNFVASLAIVIWLSSLVFHRERRFPFQTSMAITGIISYLLFGVIYLVPVELYQENAIVTAFLMGLLAYLVYNILLYLCLNQASQYAKDREYPGLIDTLGKSVS